MFSFTTRRFYGVFLTLLAVLPAGCGDFADSEYPADTYSDAPQEAQPDSNDSLDSAIPSGEELDKKIVDTLREIDQYEADHIKKILPQQTVQEFIYQKKYAEAAEAAMEVDTVDERDAFLEDIIRLQLADIMKIYKAEEEKVPSILVPESVQKQMQRVSETAERINDPVRKNDAFQSIVLFRLLMKDKKGAVQTLRTAADSLLQSNADDVRKAKGLFETAQWYLQENLKDEALKLFQTANTLLQENTEPFAGAMLSWDIAASYALLEQAAQSKEIERKAEQFTQKISHPALQAAALLRRAETSFTLRMRDSDSTLAEKIAKIKQGILEASKSVKALSLVAEPVSEENSLGLPLLSRTEMLRKKDAMLGKAAEMAVWGTTLDDVSQIIREIDDFVERDKALVAAVEMMTDAGKTEDALTWAEKITDGKIKKLMLEKIRSQQP